VTDPRYREIAADLAAKIRSGGYAPGAALPAQRELSTAYGVTLMTLRQALRRLSDDGLIVQQPGRGTFVAPPQLAYRLGTLRSLAEDLRDQGHDVRTAVLSRALRPAPVRVATQLAIPAGEVALRLERLREFAGRPAVHQVSWVRPPYAEPLRDTDFTTVALYDALAEAGISVARASETIRPDLLGKVIARHLGTPEGSPVFVSDRITYALDDTPVVADRATILGSAMAIRTERAAARLSLSWGPTS
jgi:GntR family transcriptional regulator